MPLHPARLRLLWMMVAAVLAAPSSPEKPCGDVASIISDTRQSAACTLDSFGVHLRHGPLTSSQKNMGLCSQNPRPASQMGRVLRKSLFKIRACLLASLGVCPCGPSQA